MEKQFQNSHFRGWTKDHKRSSGAAYGRQRRGLEILITSSNATSKPTEQEGENIGKVEHNEKTWGSRRNNTNVLLV
ncbi:hypothetical protein Csa_000447 [Cucumis sativus]|uniref:Uncharacterized protein n=1 Tax=Cucumis sativus TaxID=3659 RepID=A0A0A0KLL2_CUCSA|nr:hypothetical protein Csa_000447 [Cucumis sativus]